jgi:hypothetical protein
MATTLQTNDTYDNIIDTLEKTINYNLAEIASLKDSTDPDDINRTAKLIDDNTKLQKGISDIQNISTNLDEKIETINELTMYTSGIIESESILTSERLAKMKNESNKKMRMVEINNYYANKYDDQSEIMKIIIVTCVIVLFLWYINTMVQSSIFYVLIALVVALGVIIVFWKSYYLMLRNNIDYNQFDFDVKPEKLPKIDTNITAGATGISSMSADDKDAKTCENAECCTVPDYFSFQTAKCYSSMAARVYDENMKKKQ